MIGASGETDWSYLKDYPARAGYLGGVLDILRDRITTIASGRRPTKAQLQWVIDEIDLHRTRVAQADAEIDADSARRRREIDQSRRDLGMAPVQWERPSPAPLAGEPLTNSQQPERS